MMDISEKIRRILDDYLDEIELECEYDEQHSCYISPVVEFSDQIAAKAVQAVVAIYSDSFELNVYSAGYIPDPENLTETMTFMGLINNIIYPGTSIKYIPGGPLRVCRYVDCINTVGKAPSLEKIRMNMQIVLAMYEKFMDWVLAVDMGVVSAVDAFHAVLEQ